MAENDYLVLAVDIGTSSLRTALFDSGANRFHHTTAQQTYSLHTDKEGAAELSPAVLKKAFLNCLSETLETYRKDRSLQKQKEQKEQKIKAIGISCFWHSLLGTDQVGKPVSPIYTWADSRCREEAIRLRKIWKEKKIHQQTGCMLRTSYWPVKFHWLKKKKPEVLKKATYWMSPAEWLQWQWTGTRECSLSMASGTGFFNPYRQKWETSLLKKCYLKEEQLSPCAVGVGKIKKSFSNKFPELKETIWLNAIGDGAASNLGSDAAKPGVAAINVGTSAAVRVMVDYKKGKKGQQSIAPFGLFAYCVDAKRLLIGGAVSNAGNLRAWCLRELNLPNDPVVLEEALKKRKTPDHGLSVLPFWVSERAPTWCEELKGMILGFTANTSALDILQATTEAVYCRISQIAEQLPGGQGRENKFILSGGIQRSTIAMKRLSNVMGVPVMACSEPEASIRGAAVYAIEQLGDKPQALPAGKWIKPDKNIAKKYRVKKEEQHRLEIWMKA